MKQYINREKVLRVLDSVLGEVKGMADIPDNYEDGWTDGVTIAIDTIMEIPAEVGEPEHQGKWIRKDTGLVCSVCNCYSTNDHIVPYCQWCGSKNAPEGGEII